jgi:hypothetical protein
MHGKVIRNVIRAAILLLSDDAPRTCAVEKIDGAALVDVPEQTFVEAVPNELAQAW